MYTIEYSKEQEAYHIGEEIDLLEKDIRAYEERGWIGDWKVIGRFNTRLEAQNCFEFIELLLKVNYEFADDGVVR